MTTKTEATYTPGPWRVREAPVGCLAIDATDESGETVCPANVNGNALDDDYGTRTRANARLIAAAPELVEALEQAGAYVATSPGLGKLPLLDRIDALLARIREAR